MPFAEFAGQRSKFDYASKSLGREFSNVSSHVTYHGCFVVIDGTICIVLIEGQLNATISNGSLKLSIVSPIVQNVLGPFGPILSVNFLMRAS